MMPAPMMSDTAAPASLMLLNAASSVCTLSGFRRIRTITFVTTASVPSLPTIRPSRSGPGASGNGLPICTSSPFGQHRFDRQDVMDGEAVLQTMRAAGILGDVAADRAHLLTRWVGRVVVAVRRDLPGDLEIRDAGLHGHAAIGNVDVEHAIEPGEADDNAAWNRQRSTREPRAVAARDERHTFLGAQTHDRLDLCR